MTRSGALVIAALATQMGCGTREAKRGPKLEEVSNRLSRCFLHPAVPDGLAARDYVCGYEVEKRSTFPLRADRCGCTVTVGLRGSPQLELMQVLAQNCTHETAVNTITKAIVDSKLVPAPGDSAFQLDLSQPLRQLPSTSMSVTRTAWYGDVSAELRWSRDVFDISGTAEPANTETYDLRLTVGGTAPPNQVHADAKPVVSKPPQCDPRHEHMVAIPPGPRIGPVLRCTEVSPDATPAFDIDRDLVSCVDYAACVGAQACREEKDMCRPYGAVVVTHGSASAYCAWRRAKLPTFAQWQRAIRGAAAMKYPTGLGWLRDEGCKVPTAVDTTVIHAGKVRCQNTSPDGVTYYILDPDAYEWTRDTDCISSEAPSIRGVVGVSVYGETLDDKARVVQATVEGSFRCARDGL